MDFEHPKEDDPRRLKVRAWSQARPKPSGRDLADAGYATPHRPLPRDLEADAELRLIIDEEIKRATVTLGVGTQEILKNAAFAACV